MKVFEKVLNRNVNRTPTSLTPLHGIVRNIAETTETKRIESSKTCKSITDSMLYDILLFLLSVKHIIKVRE